MKKLILPLLMLAGIVNACTSEMPREDEYYGNVNTAYGYLIVISNVRQ